MALKRNLLVGLSLLAALSIVSCDQSTGATSATGSASASATETTGSSGSSTQPAVPGFTGTANLSGIDYDKKAEILGQIEKHVFTDHTSGIPLFDDGGATLLSTRVQPALGKNYLPNYGFGILREGKITSDMDAEPNVAWKRYYHLAGNSSLADGKLNVWDSNNSTASEMLSYIFSAPYATRLVKDGNGGYKQAYEWYGAYAKTEAPVPENLDATTNTATKWTIKLRTGADGLHYRTASTKSIGDTKLSSFDKKDVSIEDYAFYYKALLTGSNKYQYAGQYFQGSTVIAGASDYYQNTASVAVGSPEAEEAWKNVGIKVVGTDTIEFEFTKPQTEFDVMYNTSSMIPINEDFYKLVTHWDGKAPAEQAATDGSEFNPVLWGESYGDYTPVDTTLGAGPYILSKYDSGTGSDGEIVFDKNTDWFELALENKNGYEIYSIPGVKYSAKKQADTDTMALYNEFTKNHSIDSLGSIPTTVRDQWKGDSPEKYITSGAIIWKLQVNGTNQERWNELYGPDAAFRTNWGYDYDSEYKVKPIMSNSDFLSGVTFAINRKELSENRFTNPDSSFALIGDAYEIDPLKHVAYNTTQAHKDAISAYTSAAGNNYAYSVEAAKQLFSKAIDEEIAAGHYKAGDTIDLTAEFFSAANVDSLGKPIVGYINDAFNAVGEAKGIKLNLVATSPASGDANDVYKDIGTGHYDFAFGGLSGGNFNPFDMVNLYLDSNPYGLTMSTGNVSTNVNNGDIVYDGHSYSLDAIADAVLYGGSEIKDGVLVKSGASQQ